MAPPWGRRAKKLHCRLCKWEFYTCSIFFVRKSATVLKIFLHTEYVKFWSPSPRGATKNSELNACFFWLRLYSRKFLKIVKSYILGYCMWKLITYLEDQRNVAFMTSLSWYLKEPLKTQDAALAYIQIPHLICGYHQENKTKISFYECCDIIISTHLLK